MLLTRPGRNPMDDADRSWARSLTSAAEQHGSQCGRCISRMTSSFESSRLTIFNLRIDGVGDANRAPPRGSHAGINGLVCATARPARESGAPAERIRTRSRIPTTRLPWERPPDRRR